MRAALQAFFAPAERTTPAFVCAWLAVAAFGIVHWLGFFGRAPLALTFEDWPKERVYLEVLRESVATRTTPLHTDLVLQNTDRFLANPETLLGPQILLLPALSNQAFIETQVCLMFVIGLAGCGLLARRMRWPPFTFALFACVFSFNGWITSRIAVGQFMFAGYYLFPWMLLAVLDLLESPGGKRSVIALSWVFFALLLCGSFHLAVWWAVFLACVALRRADLRRPLLATALVAGGLCLFRLAPAAVAYHGLQRGFAGGYPSLTALFESLVDSKPYETPFFSMNGLFGRGFGWWEFDHFIGLAAMLFVFWFALKPSAGDAQKFDRRALLFGSAVLAVLSLTFFYAPIAMSPIPLANSEIVTSRFFSVAMFVLLFCACAGFSPLAPRLGLGWQALALAALVETVAELSLHSAQWRLGALELVHASTPNYADAATMHARLVNGSGDEVYVYTVIAAWTVSALVLLGTLVVWWRAGPSRTKAA